MVENINDSGVVLGNLAKVVSPRLPEPTLLIIIYVDIVHSVGQHLRSIIQRSSSARSKMERERKIFSIDRRTCNLRETLNISSELMITV